MPFGFSAGVVNASEGRNCVAHFRALQSGEHLFLGAWTEIQEEALQAAAGGIGGVEFVAVARANVHSVEFIAELDAKPVDQESGPIGGIQLQSIGQEAHSIEFHGDAELDGGDGGARHALAAVGELLLGESGAFSEFPEVFSQRAAHFQNF